MNTAKPYFYPQMTQMSADQEVGMDFGLLMAGVGQQRLHHLRKSASSADSFSWLRRAAAPMVWFTRLPSCGRAESPLVSDRDCKLSRGAQDGAKSETRSLLSRRAVNP
jgi:hypothetical protein